QSILGKAHFSDEQSARWKLAHSAARGSNPFAAAMQQIVSDFRFGYVLLPLGIIAVALSFKHRETKVLALLLLALLIFWLFMTHLQGRFFVLAIPICAMLIAQVQWKLWPPIVMLAAVVLLIV